MRLVAFAALLVAAHSGVAAATTGTELDTVAAALRRDPVYVDPGAERAISASEADDLRKRIADAGSPLFIAVVREDVADEAGGADALPAALGQRIGLSGTVAVVAGDRFRAASNVLPRGVAGRIATTVFQANQGAGTAEVLGAFVDGVAATSGGNQVSDGPAERPPSGGSGRTGWVLPALLAAGVGAFVLSSRRRRVRADREAADELAGDRLVLRAHVDVLAQDVLDLEQAARVHGEATDDYAAGVQRYRLAEAAVDRVRTRDDVARVQRVLDEATYAMDRVRAVSQGRPMPAPPPSLQAPGPNAEPVVELDEHRRPVYVDSGAGMGGFYGAGWFPGTGLLSGIMLGSILGGGWGWGGGQTVIVNEDDGGGWGDFGGSDSGEGGGFGGFGGGDWGGDVGGGDWG